MINVIDPLADPIFALIAARHRAKATMDDVATSRLSTDDEIAAAMKLECRASHAALNTPPITPAGLLAYVELAEGIYHELAEDEEGLGDWALGYASGAGDDRSAEEIVLGTLLAAVRKLCGPAGDMTVEEIDARVRQLGADIMSMNDQIAAHDLAAQQRRIPGRNIHWLNRVRKARRMRLVEIDQLRAERKRMKPFRSAEMREAICDVVRERLGAGEWDDLVAEARERIERRAAA